MPWSAAARMRDRLVHHYSTSTWTCSGAR
ncbi:MAG: hypothetical protein ACRDQZ_19120 [Mycobacteriales bacterium]